MGMMIDGLAVCLDLSRLVDVRTSQDIQPIAHGVAQHLEIISKNLQLSTRRTRILMGFIIYDLVFVFNEPEQNSGSLKKL